MNKRFFFIILLITILNDSCSTSKIPLTLKEKNFLENWKEDYISLYYDSKAIKENRQDGIYKIVYSYYNTYYKNSVFCGKDTNYIKQQAFQIVKVVKNVMGYRNNHQFIDIIISSDEKGWRKNSEGENISCSYTIRYDIASLKSKVISRYTN